MSGLRHGALTHFEFYTDVPDATRRFYEAVLGWRFEEIPDAGYTRIVPPAPPHGGLMPRRPGSFEPPAVLTYVRVPDRDAFAAAAERAGGRIVARYEVPGVGRFALFEAPGGIMQNAWETSSGQPDAPAEGSVIRHGVLVRAEPERVWHALATKEGLDGWFTDGAEVDARPGGFIRFRWRDWGPDRVTNEDGGPVREADAPRRFVFEWHSEDLERRTTVAIDLAPHADGTLVRLTDSGYPHTPAGREVFMDCAAGWGEALTLMKFHVEHGVRY